MGKEPALELDAVLGGAFAGLLRARSWSRSVCFTSSSWLSAMRGSRFMNISSRHGPGATHSEIAVAPALPDAGNSKWGAGNLQTGAPAGPFVSARTHKSNLSRTASSRAAYHSIATG
jgi:hypothetical protein